MGRMYRKNNVKNNDINIDKSIQQNIVTKQ